MLLVHFKKASLSFYAGIYLKEQPTDYCFILKVTMVFPIPTQAKETEDGEHFVND